MLISVYRHVCANNMGPARIVTILMIFVMVACTSRQPAPEPRYPDSETIKALMDCPMDRTPVCLERMGRPYRCFCGDREALQEILEPDKQPR